MFAIFGKFIELVLQMKYLILLLFCVISRWTCAQAVSHVSVSDWVIQPSSVELQKPLIFIDFWATWCGPCINAMSYTKFLDKEFKDDVLFLHLSDEDPAKIDAFMKTNEFTFYSATDETKTSLNDYDVHKLPNAILLGPMGKVVWEGSPTDIKRDDLKRYVNKFKNSDGLPSRVQNIEQVKQESNMNLFTYRSDSLFFESDTSGVLEVTIDSLDKQITGDVEKLYSYVLDAPFYAIKFSGQSTAYHFKSNVLEDDLFKGLIKEFLSTQYTLDSSIVKTGVYVLSGGDSTAFRDVSFYNYELGYAASTEDGVSLMIDNAMPIDAVNLLSEVTHYPFMYDGGISSIYDWSFFYGRRESLFDQLTNEMGFNVSFRQVPVMIYTITKK